MVNALDACKLYEYRYTYNNLSYISPPTTHIWSYEKSVEVPGVWRTDDGRSFECNGGDAPDDSFGIGCSNGVDKDITIMPLVLNGQHPDMKSGKGIVCQKNPNYFDNDCPEVFFSFRCYSKWMAPGRSTRCVLDFRATHDIIRNIACLTCRKIISYFVRLSIWYRTKERKTINVSGPNFIFFGVRH